MTDTRPNRQRRAAVYARESVDYQIAVGHQIRLCGMQAQKDGMEVPDDPAFRFSDNDATGANANRNGFQRLLRIVESGSAPFSRLYVKDRSRFGRFDDVRQQFMLEYQLHEMGVEIRYLDEDPINWGDTSGKAMGEQLYAFIRTSQTAAERHKIRERGRIGKRDAVIDGSSPHTKAPWGTERWHWNRSENRWIERAESGTGSRRPNLEIGLKWSPAKSAIILDIFEMASAGMGQAGIAEALTEREIETPGGHHVWNRNAVARILRHPIYKGTLIWGVKTSNEEPVHFSKAKSNETYPIRYPGFAPGAPVSTELWESVNRKLAGEKILWERRRATSPDFLLSGLLTCSVCGGGYAGHTRPPRKDGTRLRYYRHGTRHVPSSGSEPGVCSHKGRYLRTEPIEDAIRSACRAILTSPDYLGLVQRAIDDRLGQTRAESAREGIEELHDHAAQLGEEIKRAARRAAEEPDLHVADAHDDVAKAKAEEKRRIEARIEELKNEAQTLDRFRQQLPAAAPDLVGEVFDELGPGRLKDVIASVVHHAELTPDSGHLLLVCRTNPDARVSLYEPVGDQEKGPEVEGYASDE